MIMLVDILLIACGAYLIGSIPIGYIIGRLHGIEDIRRYGSGAIGATNVSRILGFRYFFIIFALDALKAYGYVMICLWLGMPRLLILLAALIMVIANSYPLFLRGAAGKGVATFAGSMLALNPLLCLSLIFTWLIVLMVIRVIGIASVITALLMPLYALVLTDIYGFLFIVAIAGWVIWRHRLNIHWFYMTR